MSIKSYSPDSVIEISVPDSDTARNITEFVRQTLSPPLFHHSSRVYYFAALAGFRRSLQFELELLYAAAMFHDVGLAPAYRSSTERFEIDSANVASKFLRRQGLSEKDIGPVWNAIALHTTPGIPQHMCPLTALLAFGFEMDVLGLNYAEYTESERKAVISEHPRGDHFKASIIDALYEGIKYKPATTFGTAKADVLARKDPQFQRENFCNMILNSAWPS